MTKKKSVKAVQEDKFLKQQIVNSKTFNHDVDLLNAVLKDNKKYTLKEVDEIIKNFKKGKVKTC